MKNVTKKFSYLLVLVCLIAIVAGQGMGDMNMDDMGNSTKNATVYTYDLWQSFGVYIWNSQVYSQVQW